MPEVSFFHGVPLFHGVSLLPRALFFHSPAGLLGEKPT